jgi:hypothetical protein
MRTADLHLGLLVVLLLVFLSVWVAWPVGGLVHWLRKQSPTRQPVSAWARRIALLACGLNLMYVVGLFVAVAVLGQGAFVYGIPPIIVALYSLPLLAAVLALALLFFTVLAWKNRCWSLLGRIHYSLVTSAVLVFLWFLNHWDLLGFRF